MKIRVSAILASLAVLPSFFGGSEAMGFSEAGNLRVGSDLRKLQDDTEITCTVRDWNVGNKKTHLLANLDENGKVILRWVPQNEFINMFIDSPEPGTMRLQGNLVPADSSLSDMVLTIDFLYSGQFDFTDCYCASEEFAGSVTSPDYRKIEKECTLQNFWDRPDEAEDLRFCPSCESDQCRIANERRNKNGAPEPIYADWRFYEFVSGSLSGPGLELFRRTVVAGFPSYPLEVGFGCTPDITNVKHPQLHCSNFAAPEDGFGYGVNGKDQDCGFSSWFNCRQDIDELGGDQVSVHVADINLDIVDCILPLIPSPTQGPTSGPSPSPVVSPSVQPTVSPTPCPKPKPCKKIEVCIPCKFFPDDEECIENSDNNGDWW